VVSVLSSLVVVSVVDSSEVVVRVLLVEVLDSEVEVSVWAATLFTAADPETELPQAPTARMVATARASAAVILDRDLIDSLLRIWCWWADGS
jgi:hypothetical protein